MGNANPLVDIANNAARRQFKINLKAAKHPSPGDTWSEFLCVICRVIEVTDTKVIVIEPDATKASPVGKEVTYSRAEFRRMFTYGAVRKKLFEPSDDFENRDNRFWCDVARGH